MKLILTVIILSVLIISVSGIYLVNMNSETIEIKSNIPETIVIDKVIDPIPSKTDLGFTINVSGDMHDKSFFTISGTVPDQTHYITGMIWTGKSDTLKIIYVFQTKLDKGINIFEKKVGINEGYLWQEDTTYTISINHDGKIKEIEFYRGTKINNFEDSIVPII